MSEYKHPEVLVSTDWVAQNLNSPGFALVEVDVDTSSYEKGGTGRPSCRIPFAVT
jgi:thiosulfate/3-mercaptopyruvate sulfurtransferase